MDEPQPQRIQPFPDMRSGDIDIISFTPGDRPYQRFWEWDNHSLLVLSLFLAGWLPVGISLGVAVAVTTRSVLPEWGSTLAGAGAFAGVIALHIGLLWLLTRQSFRQWFIPLARRLFPSAEDLAERRPLATHHQEFTVGEPEGERPDANSR